MYAFYLNKTHENLNTYTLIYHIEKHFPNATSNTLAGPGAGGTTGAPLTAADLWFFMPKTLIFLIGFSN